MSGLQRAIEVAGTPAELARRIGLSPQAIFKWQAKRGVPLNRCAAVEDATGVRCEELRPDVQWMRDKGGAVIGHVVPLTALPAPADSKKRKAA